MTVTCFSWFRQLQGPRTPASNRPAVTRAGRPLWTPELEPLEERLALALTTLPSHETLLAPLVGALTAYRPEEASPGVGTETPGDTPTLKGLLRPGPGLPAGFEDGIALALGSRDGTSPLWGLPPGGPGPGDFQSRLNDFAAPGMPAPEPPPAMREEMLSNLKDDLRELVRVVRAPNSTPTEVGQPRGVVPLSGFQNRLEDITVPQAPPAVMPAAPAIMAQPGGAGQALPPEAVLIRSTDLVKMEDIQDNPEFLARLDQLTLADENLSPSAEPLPLEESNLALVGTLIAARAKDAPAAAPSPTAEGEGLGTHPGSPVSATTLGIGVEEALALQLSAARPYAPAAQTAALQQAPAATPAFPMRAEPDGRLDAEEPFPREWNPWLGLAAPRPTADGTAFLLGEAAATASVAAVRDRRDGPNVPGSPPPPGPEDTEPAPSGREWAPHTGAGSSRASATTWAEVVAASFAAAPTLPVADRPGAGTDLPEKSGPAVQQDREAAVAAPCGERRRTVGVAPELLLAAVFAAGLCQPWLERKMRTSRDERHT